MDNSNTLMVLIAGTGSIGRRHIGNIRGIEPRAQFLLLRTDGRHDDLSRALGAIVVASIDEALEYSIDCSVVATPSALHREVLVPLLLNKVPVYIEKPVVTSHEQLVAVREALDAVDYQAPSMAGCNMRFLPSLQTIHRLLKDGAIGYVARAGFEAGQWLPDWRPSVDHRTCYSANSALGGGVVLDLVHELDAARWLLGEVDTLRVLSNRFDPLEIESEAVAVMALRHGADGPLSSISLDYVSRRPLRRYSFVGDRGTMIWDLAARQVILDNGVYANSLSLSDDAFDVRRTYATAMNDFIASIRAGAATQQDIREGLASSELAILAKEQI